MNTVTDTVLPNAVLSNGRNPKAGLPTKPKSAEAARTSGNSIDYLTEVEKVAKRKAEIGISFTSKKGKQSLFSGVCGAVLSLRGMAKTDKLQPEEIASIESAIAQFWQLQANRILSYGRVTGASYDKPSAVFNKAGEVANILLKASLRAERDPKDKAEERLYTLACVAQAKKRMDYMLENLPKFERSEMDVQRKRIEALEAHYVSLQAPAPAPAAPAAP